MSKRTTNQPAQPSRRRVITQGAALGAAALGAPWVARFAHAQNADLGPWQAAKVNWRQAEGESITVAVIPATYFDNLIAIAPQFEALTGVKVRFEKVPPGQIRQKAMLDLSSKTATYATSGGRSRCTTRCTSRTSGSIRSTSYLNDPTLTDAAWFNYDDILKAWRDADSIDGKPYGIPYDGEVTVQVYRKDLYDAKGLKPAETYDELVCKRQGAHRSGEPHVRPGAARLRGCGPEHVHLPVALPRLRRPLVRTAMRVVVNSPQAVDALAWYVDTLTQYAPPAVRNWNWPDIADAFSQGTVATYIDAHSSAAVITNPEKSKVVGKIALRALAEGAERQARHLDLELGLPDQRRAVREAEEGDLAVHRVGGVGGDAGAHVVEVRRARPSARA